MLNCSNTLYQYYHFNGDLFLYVYSYTNESNIDVSSYCYEMMWYAVMHLLLNFSV